MATSRRNALRAAALAWCVLLPPGAARAETTPCRPSFKELPGRGSITIEVDWCGSAPPALPRIKTRIDEKTRVTVLVRNFNFLYYGLEYKVEETVVETYATLQKLWGQVFRFASIFAALPPGAEERLRTRAAQPCDTFGACLAEWLWEIRKASIALDSEVQKYANERQGLRPEAVTAIHAYATEDIPAVKGRIRELRERTLNQGPPPVSVAEVDLFDRVEAEHAKLLEKLDAFVLSAELIQNGQLRVIGKKKPGTIVTVTLTPKGRLEGSPGGEPLPLEYFVHSRFPVTYHMGYAYSRLRDVDFEKVRSLSNQDLFSLVKKEQNTNTFTAFLSYGVRSWPADNPKGGLYLTLGTDFEKPGQRLYAGASVRLFERLLLNAGWASATVKEGRDGIVEPVGDGLQTRQLFGATVTRRQWGFFFGASFVVF